jgi:hypothetical protein
MYRTMLIPHSLPHNGVRRFSKQAYSPECVEVEFCELRLNGVLGSSWLRTLRLRLRFVNYAARFIADSSLSATLLCAGRWE